MMKITRSTEYAIRGILHLALKPEGETSTVSEIAKERQAPREFLSKIFQKMAKENLLVPYQGVKGGYLLARHPSKISLLDIIEATQGPVNLNVCLIKEKGCPLQKSCAFYPIWRRLQEQIVDLLRKTTIDDAISAYEGISQVGNSRRGRK